jgi:protocatechuate 3,4-dioxygenase beta subunit
MAPEAASRAQWGGMNDKPGRVEQFLAARRDAMKLIGGGLVLLGCGSSNEEVAPDAGASPDASTCPAIPEETIGPYPDKTGMLTSAAYNRRDITEDRAGLKLDLVLSIVDSNASCAAVAEAQVIVWQCDADGHYSEYSGQPGGYDGSGATFLRGVQTTDASGQVTFRTIYPGWYPGRATHIHVQVFVGGLSRKVTQLAFPEAVNSAVYASGVYAAKGQNPQTNARDTVFADSLQSELASVAGDPSSGYIATATLGVAL